MKGWTNEVVETLRRSGVKLRPKINMENDSAIMISGKYYTDKSSSGVITLIQKELLLS